MTAIRAEGFIGVDVGAEFHVVHVLDSAGVELTPAFRIPNHIQGHGRLLGVLDRLCSKHHIRAWTAGLEVSYGCEQQLAAFLQDRGVRVLQLTPKEVDAQRYLLSRKGAKTDWRDAEAMAHLVRAGRGTPMQVRTRAEDALRAVVQQIEDLKRHRGRIRDLCQRQVSTRYRVSRKQAARLLSSDTGRTFLAAHPWPPAVGDQSFEDFKAEARTRARGKLHARVLARLYEICKRCDPQLCAGRDHGPGSSWSVQELIEVDRQVRELADDLATMLEGDRHFELLKGVPGIGRELAPVILSRAGDIRRFKHPKQFERYAGLDLTQEASSDFRTRARISKCGDPRLRRAIYSAVGVAIIRPDNRFGRRYAEIKARKGDTSEVRRKTRVKLAAKMARTIWAVVTKEAPYCDYQQPT